MSTMVAGQKRFSDLELLRKHWQMYVDLYKKPRTVGAVKGTEQDLTRALTHGLVCLPAGEMCVFLANCDARVRELIREGTPTQEEDE